MTREQLDAIRARVEAATPGPWKAERWCSNNPSVAEAWGLNGMRTFADAVFCGHAREDVPALLAEVERLTAEVESKTGQNVALMGMNGRLQQEVERLTAERDAARLAVRALPIDIEADRAFDALQPSLGTPVPPERRIRRQTDVDAAFARGSEAMRTAAVEVASKRANLQRLTDSDMAWGRSAECILDELRHLAVTEDKP
jgi:uncharacterized small protein (DUF1192 family)